MSIFYTCHTGSNIVYDIIGKTLLIMTFLLTNIDSTILISHWFQLQMAMAKES